MPSTFDTVAEIVAEACDIPRDEIDPDSHLVDDLGLDSLEIADVAFSLDLAFGIVLPIERWNQNVSDRGASSEDYLVVKNLCAQIDRLVAAKSA